MNDAARWIRMKALFRQAFDLPRGEQTAFLKDNCDDPQLQAEVEALLESHEDAADQTQAQSPGAPQAAAVSEGFPEKAIGPYVLRERIGEGGFGTVYLAEQLQPVRRQVALKILKLGMDTREIVARFEQERQALALMEHPAIARVYDGGTTPSGRPYFVMELVRGVPITEYCDSHQLRIPERLRIFMQVCDALQHAHQKGIIHRDIKPSNILVSDANGGAHPKVIDFGIAKAMRSTLSEHRSLTGIRQLVGTPQYMSPEQAEGNPDIDTRSDVYSLGVVLYELLAGATPFDARLFGSVADMQRAIREIDPPKPSTRLQSWNSWQSLRLRSNRVSSNGDSSELHSQVQPAASPKSSAIEIARQRQLELPALVRQLRGEPDWIVMKALQKDRALRYESVRALTDDLKRFLNHQPIQAGPPSFAYQVRKFVRRHRFAVIAGTLVILALVAGVIGTTIGFLKATAAQREEERQRERAESREGVARAAAEKSKQIARLLESILASAQPSVAKGRDTTLLGEILAGGESRIDQELADQPEVAASLRKTIGNALTDLDDFSNAEKCLRRALTDAQQAPANSPILAEVHQSLGYVIWRAGRSAEAEKHTRQAIDLFSQLEGDASEHIRGCMIDLGSEMDAQGRYDEAIAVYEQKISKLKESGEEQSADMARVLNNLAGTYMRVGRHDRCEALQRQVLPLHRKLFGDESFQTALTCENLAFSILRRGRIAEAEPFVNEAISLYMRIFGEDHSHTAYAIHLLGDIHMGKCEYPEAEREYSRALAIFRRQFPGAHRSTATELESLAWVRLERGDIDDAEKLFREMMDQRRQLLGEDNLDFAMALNNFGVFLSRAGREDDARRNCERAIALAEKLAGTNSPLALAWRRNRASLLAFSGDVEGAIAELRGLLAQYEAISDAVQVDVMLANELLGEQLAVRARQVWDDQPEPAFTMAGEAEDRLRESLDAIGRSFGGDHWNVLRTRSALSDILAERSWRSFEVGESASAANAHESLALAEQCCESMDGKLCLDRRTQCLLNLRLGAGLTLRSNLRREPLTEGIHRQDAATAERLLLSVCTTCESTADTNKTDRRMLRNAAMWLDRLYSATQSVISEESAASLARWRLIRAD